MFDYLVMSIMMVHYQGREVSPLVSILESFTSSTPTELRTFASNNRFRLMASYSTEAVLSFLPIMMVLRMRMDRFAESVQV